MWWAYKSQSYGCAIRDKRPGFMQARQISFEKHPESFHHARVLQVTIRRLQQGAGCGMPSVCFAVRSCGDFETIHIQIQL